MKYENVKQKYVHHIWLSLDSIRKKDQDGEKQAIFFNHYFSSFFFGSFPYQNVEKITTNEKIEGISPPGRLMDKKKSK